MKRPAVRGLVVVAALAVAAACVIPLSSTSGSGSSPDASMPGKASDGGLLPDGAAADGFVPPSGTWTNLTGDLANMASQCGNLTSMFVKPDEDLVGAGVALDWLWVSREGGAWEPLGGDAAAVASADAAAVASVPLTARPSSFVFDPDASSRFWVTGFDNSSGVYVTNDDGNSFTWLGGLEQIDLVAVDFTDPNRQTLLAGGHEVPQYTWLSTNGGLSWTNVGLNLPPSTWCNKPLILGPNTYFVGCSGYASTPDAAPGPTGIYGSTDGVTWTMASAVGGFGVPLVASDGSVYWAMGGGAGMVRSTDQGQTWKQIAQANVVASNQPIELPDHRIATIGPLPYGQQYILASADQGATWQQLTTVLPIQAVGLVYSAQEKAFFIWYFTCGTGANPVPTDAIWRYDFDAMEQ